MSRKGNKLQQGIKRKKKASLVGSRVAGIPRLSSPVAGGQRTGPVEAGTRGQDRTSRDRK